MSTNFFEQSQRRPRNRKETLQDEIQQMLSALPDAPQPTIPDILPADADNPEADFQLRGDSAAIPSIELGRSQGSSRRTASVSRANKPVAENSSMTGNLGERVLAELEKYAIPVVSQLRIAVHGGTVAIMGAVPTEYEKQLVHHFSQKVPGVTQVVNLMRVIGGPGLTNGPEIPGARRGASPRRQRARSVSGMQLRFPFSARQLGTVAALLLLAWAGISFGMRDGSKLSVYPVTGRVEFEGATPDGAVLVLHPVDDQITMQPKALVKADGTFAFTTYLPADGAPAGDYRLTMTWNRLVEVDGEPVPGPNLLPAELADPATTKHQLTIATGNNELPPLQITQ